MALTENMVIAVIYHVADLLFYNSHFYLSVTDLIHGLFNGSRVVHAYLQLPPFLICIPSQHDYMSHVSFMLITTYPVIMSLPLGT